ncbi:MAG: hypothetical protein GF353_05230 [Candidatus Lokiarchaeota archaeon]|nr:hypothetical protein [Candidatus Lokiarchaeota archaeon]
MLKRIKNTLLGGNFSYSVTKDKKFFIKFCKGKKEWVSKEFYNLKNNRNKIDIERLQLVEPILYSEDKEYIITKYIDGQDLVELLDPSVYFSFGKMLKLLHEKGFTHSHMELNDVIFKNGNFTLVDTVFLNEKIPDHDLVTAKISAKLNALKQPWNYYKYMSCIKALFEGYKIENYDNYKKEYKRSLENRIRLLMRIGKKNKIKAYLLKFLYKIGYL